MTKVVNGKKKGIIPGVFFSYVDVESGKIVRQLMYVDFTYKTTEHYLQGFKSMIRNKQTKANEKLLKLRINLNDLSVQLLAPCFLEDANKTMNFYMEKHNTIEKGWNVELKEI